ncbi:MAG: hypothetical protein KDB53_14280 [Planctomycetes bacterium]|nr:hypothetical protein [Planctomycetota bacterium]
MTFKSLLVLATVMGMTAISMDGPCDLKTLESGYYCEACEAVLKADQRVSDKTYYECPDCGDRATKAGDCDGCETTLVKKTSGKNVCPTCFEAPTAADLCVKSYFACPKCSATSAKAEKCAKCEVDFAAQTSRTVVTYECSECGASAHKATKCDDQDCERHGKAFDVKSCATSGTFPHSTAKSDD